MRLHIINKCICIRGAGVGTSNKSFILRQYINYFKPSMNINILLVLKFLGIYRQTKMYFIYMNNIITIIHDMFCLKANTICIKIHICLEVTCLHNFVLHHFCIALHANNLQQYFLQVQCVALTKW